MNIEKVKRDLIKMVKLDKNITFIEIERYFDYIGYYYQGNIELRSGTDYKYYLLEWLEWTSYTIITRISRRKSNQHGIYTIFKLFFKWCNNWISIISREKTL